MLKNYFSEKESKLKCKNCKHEHDENGTEIVKIIEYPRYLILFIDPENEDDETKKQTRKFRGRISLTKHQEDTN